MGFKNMLGFVEGGKPERSDTKCSETNNKLNLHENECTGIKPRSQRWEASLVSWDSRILLSSCFTLKTKRNMTSDK